MKIRIRSEVIEEFGIVIAWSLAICAVGFGAVFLTFCGGN